MSWRGPRVQLIDCDYLMPEFAGVYLLHSAGEAAFVETNTAHSVPRLMDALKKAGGQPEDVRYVIVTHAHLDHSGGASLLMKSCPRATLLAHPRAARHLVDPTRLVGSARKVYGEAAFEKLYGTIEAIPAERVRTMEDGEEAEWGGGRLRFLHTRGHANHHAVVQDLVGEGVFTGDSFGLMYPRLQSRGLFVFPSTSPTDFDGPAARASVRRIAECGARTAWLTHFGAVTDLAEARSQLDRDLERSEAVLDEAVRSSAPDGELDAWCEARLITAMKDRLTQVGLGADGEVWRTVELDVRLNGAGLGHAARLKRAEKAGSGGAPLR